MAGDDPQGGAVRVVPGEHLHGVVIGDVADPAAVGQRLLHFAGFTQPPDIDRTGQLQSDLLEPVPQRPAAHVAVEPADGHRVGVHHRAQGKRRRVTTGQTLLAAWGGPAPPRYLRTVPTHVSYAHAA